MTYGQALSQWRQSLSLKQKELAAILNVSRQTISNWERDVSQPDLDSLIILSEKFQISINDILDHEIENKKDFSDRT